MYEDVVPLADEDSGRHSVSTSFVLASFSYLRRLCFTMVETGKSSSSQINL